jgi:hypothetical protein
MVGTRVVAGRHTTVSVSRETKRMLDELKVKLGTRNYSELLGKLIEAYREYLRYRTRSLVCGELVNHRAAPAEWFKLLYDRLGDLELVLYALDYLAPDRKDYGILVVDSGRCRG